MKVREHFALLVGSGDQHDVVNEAGKEAGARIAAQINRGDDPVWKRLVWSNACLTWRH